MNSMEAVLAPIVAGFEADPKRCESRLQAGGPVTVEQLEQAVGELRRNLGRQVAE